MTETHYHWHKVVAETKTHVYYQCACGSRHAGHKPWASPSSVDTEWVNGANRSPR